MPAESIDQVLTQLDGLILRARQERNRLGFFATLYRNVTLRVKEGITAGQFEDGARMERLDVAFANRYLGAIEGFNRHEQISKCWLVSFQAGAKAQFLILQHLLMGINAHINFDLGIAAQQTAPGAQLPSLKHDFDQINNILGAMVAKVRSDVEEVSPLIREIDRFDPAGQTQFINFSFDKARASSWLVATMLNTTPPDQLARKLGILDDGVAVLASLIAHPQGLLLNLALHGIRLRESNDVPHIIDVLSQT